MPRARARNPVAADVASAIVRSGSQAGLASLVAFTRSSTNKVQRRELLMSLASSPDAAARDYVQEVVREDTPEGDTLLRTMAWSRAGDFKKEAVAGLRSERPSRRAAAISVIGALSDRESVATVVAAIDDDDETVRGAALSALQSNQSEAATDALIAAFPTLEKTDQRRVVYGLARTGDPRAISHIKDVVEQGGNSTYAAVQALIAVGSTDVMRYLEGLAERDDEVGQVVGKQLASQLGIGAVVDLGQIAIH